MTYTDGNEAKLGDEVIISDRYNGTVVANIDGDEYADTHPKRDWSQLSSGATNATTLLKGLCRSCLKEMLGLLANLHA